MLFLYYGYPMARLKASIDTDTDTGTDTRRIKENEDPL